MKDTLITEILRPAYAVLDKYVRDRNGEDITSYLSHAEQSILADVSQAVDTIRDDLDKLFTDMLGEEDDDDDSRSVLPERDENNLPPSNKDEMHWESHENSQTDAWNRFSKESKNLIKGVVIPPLPSAGEEGD